METVTSSMVRDLKSEIGKAFVGRDETINLLVSGLVSGLSVLIEDIPGVGKTTLARSLARACGLDFGRIQFTPDLLPGDIVGTTVWSQELRDFIFKPGAVMHQFVLADEINRATARTQSALLEAMQEGSVTVDGRTHLLPQPFFVVATQNPISFAGTFALPEAQLDRFGLSLAIGYPEREHEFKIIMQAADLDSVRNVGVVIAGNHVEVMRSQVRSISVDRRVVTYVIEIAERTRKTSLLKAGMSPRAGQHLLRAAQAVAYLSERPYVLPEDVRSMVVPVLAHRLGPSPETRLSGRGVRDVLDELVSAVPLPAGI